jgi:hypothetical protein
MNPTIYMVRTHSAGVFFGEIVERNGKEVMMRNARRVWYWAGAATLSQLATEGTTKPKQCKFPCTVPEVVLTEAIEILPMTAEAVESLGRVPVWAE